MSLIRPLQHEGNRSSAHNHDDTTASWAPALALTAALSGAAWWRWSSTQATSSDAAVAARQRRWHHELGDNAAYQAALFHASHDDEKGSPAGQLRPAKPITGLAAVDRAIATVANATGLVAPLPEGAAEAVVALTEFVVLPDETSAGVQELGLRVRGELRLHTYLSETLRATVKLSGPQGSAGAGRGSPATEHSWTASAAAGAGASRGATDSVRGEAPRTAIPAQLDNVSLHDTVDERLFLRSQSQQLRCVPGRTSTTLLMTYESTTADEVVPSVVARECVVQPSSTPGAYTLTVALEATAASQDICVDIVLPKRATLRSSPEIDRGQWGQPRGGSSTEYQWHAGDVHADASAPRARSQRDDADAYLSSPSVARPAYLRCVWEYDVPPETLAYASRSNTPHPTSRGQQQQPSSSEQSLTQQSAPWHALLPSVTLSYMAPVSSSGVRVRKLTFDGPMATVANEEGSAAASGAAGAADLSGVSGAWVPVHNAAHTTASYRTMYSQSVRVLAEL